MRKTRFQISKRDIVTHFSEYGNHIFSYLDISRILTEKRNFWRLPVNLTTNEFIDLLTTYTRLKKYEFKFPRKTISRFVWGDISIFKLALGLEKNSYLTHYSAVYLHDLTEQIPKTIYVNVEQPMKRSSTAKLSQNSIDRAFSNHPRLSNNTATLKDYKICLLNGKHTNRLGVIEIDAENEKIMVTDIERTLIDIAVRPSYAGGIHEVLKAYKQAVGKVSINKLTAMLQKLSYIYPYHQAVGFYLQKSGVYKESQVQLLKKFNFKFDFYLTHRMTETQYSKEWRLYYPRGF